MINDFQRIVFLIKINNSIEYSLQVSQCNSYQDLQLTFWSITIANPKIYASVFIPKGQIYIEL